MVAGMRLRGGGAWGVRMRVRAWGVVAIAAGAVMGGVCWAGPASGQGFAGVTGPAPVPVYVEDAIGAREAVEAAMVLRAEGRVGEAIARLGEARELAGARLLEMEPGRYRDAGLEIEARIAADAALLGAYREMAGPVAERRLAMLEPGDLAGLMALSEGWWLTEAGYLAGLDAAGLLLERAEAGEALGLLDRLAEHPDAESVEAGRRAVLRASALRLLGDEAGVARVLRGDERGEVQAAIAGLPRGAAAGVGRMGGDMGGEAEAFDAAGGSAGLMDGGVRALWSWSDRASATQVMNAGRRGVRPAEPMARTAWSGDRLLLNLGDEVVGLDRYSGREAWRLGLPGPVEPMPGAALNVEPQGVWVGEQGWGCALLTSRSVARFARRGPMQPLAGEVVAFETGSGAVLWRTPTSAMGDAAEGAVLVGEPLVSRDRVVVLLRRSRVSGFQDTVAVGLEASTGAVAWTRHVASTATNARFTDWPTPAALARDGVVFVNDRLGAVAAISLGTGRVRWLTVLAKPSDAARRGGSLRTAQRPRGGGVLAVEAGLLVSLASDADGAVLLDPADGLRLSDGAGAMSPVLRRLFNQAGAIRGYDGDVIVVGAAVARLDGRTLGVKWERAGALDGGLVGVPAVSGGTLVASSGSGLVGVGLADGQTVFTAEAPERGNVAAMGSQVVVSGPEMVVGLLDWRVASDRLVRRLGQAASANDPEPGLALAHAAWEAGESGLILRGVDHALRAGAGSAGVFDQLLGLVTDRAAGAALRFEVLERLAMETSTAGQEVSIRFARGELLGETDRPADALKQYQSVLADPTLRERLYEGSRVDRLAGLEARARIEALLEAEGAELYAAYDEAARRRLDGLRATGTADVASLTDLAASYPLADCAAEAWLEAGVLEASAERWAAASRLLRRAYAVLPSEDAALAGEVAGRLAQASEAQGRPGGAMGWLRRFARDYPGAVVWTAEGERPLDAVMMLMAMRAEQASPRVALDRRVGEADVIEGRMLSVRDDAGQSSSAELVLIERRGRLVGVSAATGEDVWEAAIGADGAELLSMDESHAVVWLPTGQRVFGVELNTGREAWPFVDVEVELDLLGEVADEAVNEAQRRFLQELGPNNAAVAQLRARMQRAGDRLVIGELLPLRVMMHAAAGRDAVVVADVHGRAMAIDAVSGEVMWRQRTPLRNVAGVSLDDGRVALHGVMFPGEAHEGHAALVLDAATGGVVLGPLEFAEPLADVRLTGDGGMLVVTSTEASWRSLENGGLRWRTRLGALESLASMHVGPQSAMLVVRRERNASHTVIGLDLLSGTVLRGAERVMPRLAPPPRPVAHDGGWLIAGSAHLYGLGTGGELAWVDAATLPMGGMVVGVFVGSNHAVAVYAEQRDARREVDRQRLLTYELATGRIVGDEAVEFAVGRPSPAAALTRRDALFLGLGERTVRFALGETLPAVPVSAPPDAATSSTEPATTHPTTLP
ncbi:MAG: PQQ-binding-like beta-propeller repeat protein [Planctomycetota bacterium]